MTDDVPAIDSLLQQATKAAERQQLDRAEALLTQILARDESHLRALDLFGFVRFFQGRIGEAEALCRRALAISPDHAYAHKGLGLCLARQGRIDEGVASLEQAIETKPTWFDPHWDLAVVLLDAERFDEALAAVARGTKAVPGRSHELAQLRASIEKRQKAAVKKAS